MTACKLYAPSTCTHCKSCKKLLEECRVEYESTDVDLLEGEESDPLVWLKDKEGNEFICHLSQLKDPKKASKEELANCVDSGSAAYDPSN